ncbi:sensor histidine kinase [Gryllotalpicola protaetiae]|uniref:ATP-binding protein n=1 Tax=Gryllotalpicola protaetiae TaxID=2419771 RepID=A0A387BNH8_9MICO|nr:ATP-binding protein [Gryllotalpicola protaetiae]AYG04258.1 ATP-binding protein [Gryllotalpicola protaetiae]
MSSAEPLPSALPPAPRYPLTQARIETMVSRAIVLFGLVFGVLVIPTLITQQGELPQPLGWLQAAALCVCLLWAVVGAVSQRGVGAATTVFAIVYLIVVALWPITVAGSKVDGTPWLWTLCTVASAYAAVRLRAWMAAVYVVLAPALFGIVLIGVSDGREWDIAVLDAIYAAIVGAVILTIASLLRNAAAAVDTAQRAALDGYERGVREHLGEAERVEVDALVHDSVLTTLLAAASARTPETKQLAARMAEDALGHLSSTKPVPTSLPEQLTDAWALVAGIRSAAASIAHRPRFLTDGPLAARLPESVAEALTAATVQAMMNSSQHAGGADVARSVTFSGIGAGDTAGVRIEIVDDGVGFDVARVAPRRLGLANSIVQRVEMAGGVARVDSAPGVGTAITLSWPS